LTARYFAVRRLNPYRGVTQTIDIGEASAQSMDGVTWHLRADDGFGWVRPVGIWVEGEGLRAGVAERYPGLIEALCQRPKLPFRLADSMELWLLDRETGLPLALLDSTRPSLYVPGRIEPEWLPFVKSYTGFHSAALAARANHGWGVSAHRDTLARIVNDAARPHASAQWFKRQPDGSGIGMEGLRLEARWLGRSLAATDFPELMVRLDWNNRLEQSVITDYHAWVSPLLLLLPGLTDPTRDSLEQAARQRVRWLLQVHRLIPKVLDLARFNANLVAARLEAASGDNDGGYEPA
jgi:hypothetical protein